MLQERQFVLAPAHRGDQPLGEALVKLGAVHLRRPAHGAHEAVVVHARHEILRLVDRFGETGEAGAFAKKFRAHGDDHVEVDCVRCGFGLFGSGALNEIDEQLGLIAARLLLVAEQLLELVDKQAKALALHALDGGGD